MTIFNIIKNTKKPKLLVSFCNIFPNDLALGIVDYQNNQFQWIDLERIQKTVHGTTGIILSNNQYFCLTQLEGNSGLSVLNSKMELENFFSFPTSHDVHSIIPIDDGFLVTDTSKNRINKIVINYNKNELEEIEFWKYNNDETDTVHINSMTKCDGKIYISIMGQKDEKGWSFTENGKIIEIPTNRVICQNIHHPHSLLTIDDELYCLESKTSSIHRFSKMGNHEIILKLEGYLRGFTFDSKNFYVASSGVRKRSKGTGTVHVPVSTDPEDTHSWIYKINRKTLEYEKKDLTVFGTEIFDLVIIPSKIVLNLDEDAVLKRIWKYEEAVFNIRENR